MSSLKSREVEEEIKTLTKQKEQMQLQRTTNPASRIQNLKSKGHNVLLTSQKARAKRGARKRIGDSAWGTNMRRKKGARAAHRVIRESGRVPGEEAREAHRKYGQIRRGELLVRDLSSEEMQHLRKLPEARAVATEREQEAARERLGMVRHAASYRRDLPTVLRELHDPLAEEKRRQEQQRKNPWSIFDSRTWTNLEGI